MMMLAHARPAARVGARFDFSERGDALVGQKMFEILDSARELEVQGHRVYHLELGNPRLPPPAELVEATIRSLQNVEVGYTYAAGHPVLRQAIAALYNRQQTRRLCESEVIISPANLIINQFLDLTCNAGDAIVLFTPAFPTYWAAASHIGLKVHEIALDPATGFVLTEDDVKRAVAHKPRAIIVNSANNPTGAVYERHVLEGLASLCDRDGIWLLSDETYGAISFGREFHSLAGLQMPGLVVMSSFSKIFSVPGFRIGYALAAPDVSTKLALATSTLISCLPIFTQLGCATAISQYLRYAAAVRARCAAIAGACVEQLSASPHIKFSSPDAGFYFFLDISAAGMDDLTFSRRLLHERQTAVTPGSSFGSAYSQFVRIATCGYEGDVHEGTRRLSEFCQVPSSL
jgi:aspartate/methionine/tyrosine aminotransferase